MRIPLSCITRALLTLGVVALSTTSSGCRSTRSSISNLPGMAWVGPNEEESSFGEWTETSPSGLPTPSREAVPQLASKTGPAVELPGAERRAAGQTAASSSARDDGRENMRTSYPDTGYDSLYNQPPANAPAANYATGNYDPASRAAGGTSSPTARTARAAEPRRGFYGDDYQGEPEDTSSAAADTARYADAAPNDSSSSSSRYSDPPTRGGGTAEDTGPYGDTNPAGRSRYSAEEEPAGQVAEHAADAPHQGSRWAEDAADDFNQLRRQAATRSREAASDYRDEATALADSTANGASTDANPVTGIARDVAQDVRQTYEHASTQVRDRVAAGAENLTESGRSLGRDAEGLAHRAIDGAGQAAAGLTDGLRSGYSRFSQTDEGNEPVADSAGQMTESSDAAYGSENANDMAQTGDGDDNVGASALPQDSALPSRSNQPWRPGSTGSLPRANGVDASPRSTQRSYPTAPASYDAAARERFARVHKRI